MRSATRVQRGKVMARLAARPEQGRNQQRAAPWSVEKLKRATKRFVAEGLADPALLGPARRKPANDRLVSLVAGVARANPDLTLEQIGAQLEAM